MNDTVVGQRLDRFLATVPEITSRNYAQDLIHKGHVLVDQKEVRSSLILKLNQIIEINLPELISSELVPFELKLEILFEDDDLIVVNKPSGLVVHPAAGHEQDTLVNALLFHTKNLSMKNEQRPGIVHRLDKETSGLLVIAKNDISHEKLSQQFRDKTTHRVYYALVCGSISKKNGIVQSFLARHPSNRKKYASVKSNNRIITTFSEKIVQGKWAVTKFEKISQASGMTYVKLKLETGRTHQIRVHLSEMGHCLVGDIAYGYSAQKATVQNLNRFYLHAAELGFVHPKTNETLLFKVSWPTVDLLKLQSLGFKIESV